MTNNKPTDKTSIVVTEDEAIFVAKAMDIDGTLIWNSNDHQYVVGRENAKRSARGYIAAHRACQLLDAQPKSGLSRAEDRTEAQRIADQNAASRDHQVTTLTKDQQAARDAADLNNQTRTPMPFPGNGRTPEQVRANQSRTTA